MSSDRSWFLASNRVKLVAGGCETFIDNSLSCMLTEAGRNC